MSERRQAYILVAPVATIFAGIFVVPFCYFFVISFWSTKAYKLVPTFTFANYIKTIVSYGDTLLFTMQLAFVVAALTTVLGFFYAYLIRFKAGAWTNAFLLVAMLTLFGGYLMKIYAWKTILGNQGALNSGLMTKWWEAMLANPAFTSALTNSLIIGLVVSVISAILGTMAAMGLSQFPPAVANSVMLVLSTPLMLPPLVLGVALLSFYVAAGIRLGLVTVIMSQLLFTLPFVILVIVARLRSFDFRIVESARDLGASQLTAFRTVTLPVIQPSIIGAALISLDDFIVTFFTIGSGNTLPTFVWGMIRTSLTPTANAIGTLILILTLTSTIVALRLTRYRG